ncbi:MAG: Uncharacterised protein [Flavobacteriales bacterium UBA4585]|nr:MAG: Uncharacterised protein [Flavobacteriales bacterium UBA4585]
MLGLKRYKMFGLFKKKSEKEKLEAQYDALIKKSYELSHSNRAESDKVQAQAQEVLKQIEALED